jgi:tellurite resistance protein
MSVEHFRILAAAAMVDGSLSDSERPVLLAAAKDLGVLSGAVDGILLEFTGGTEAAEAEIPSNPGDRAKVFRSLIDLMAADGKIDKDEQKLFVRLAPRFGLNELEAEDLLHAATHKRI